MCSARCGSQTASSAWRCVEPFFGQKPRLGNLLNEYIAPDQQTQWKISLVTHRTMFTRRRKQKNTKLMMSLRRLESILVPPTVRRFFFFFFCCFLINNKKKSEALSCAHSIRRMTTSSRGTTNHIFKAIHLAEASIAWGEPISVYSVAAGAAATAAASFLFSLFVLCLVVSLIKKREILYCTESTRGRRARSGEGNKTHIYLDLGTTIYGAFFFFYVIQAS